VLGGSSTLRGFREYRFRDRDAFALSGEYRYAIWEYLDAVLFADAGQVYSNIFQDLDDDGLHTSAGFGLRFHSRLFNFQATFGHSSEGTRAFLKFGTPLW
jgi:outer membrane protein assembly factor BamA